MVVGEFLFLVTKSLKSRRLDLLSNHEICFQNFSFSSRNWRKLQISRLFFAKILVLFSNQKTDLDISLLEIRDMDSIFLFLFSISLFGVSSMPGWWGVRGGNSCLETLEGKGRASRAAVEGRARRKQLCSYKHSIAAQSLSLQAMYIIATKP